MCSERTTVQFAELRAATEHERERLTQAVSLARNGLYGGARDIFAEVFELLPQPTVAWYLAQSEMKLGRWVRARELLEAIIHGAPSDSEQPSLAEAREALASADEQIASLVARVRLDPSSASSDAVVVTLDRHRVTPELLLNGVPIDPGVHEIAAWAKCHQFESRTVSVAAGAKVEIELELPRLR